MRASRVVALVFGCLLLVPAIAVLVTGGAIAVGYAAGRDDDGYINVTLDRLETDTVAITADDLGFTTEPGSPDWVLDALDTDLRIRATGADPDDEIFIGIASQRDVDDYLRGVAHDEVIDLDDGLDAVFRTQPGGTSVAPPTEQDFWVATATGSDTNELRWEATSGQWAVVAMNADGTPGVAVDVRVGAKAAFVMPLAFFLIGLGVVMTIVGVVLIVVGTRRDTPPVPAGLVPIVPPHGTPLPPPVVPPTMQGDDVASPAERERQDVST